MFREEQIGIRQILLMEEGSKCLTISKPKNVIDDTEGSKLTAIAILRTVPGIYMLFFIQETYNFRKKSSYSFYRG